MTDNLLSVHANEACDTSMRRCDAIVPRDPCVPMSDEMWEALHDRWPDAGPLGVAFRIAKDLDACRDLLIGRLVDPLRLDGAEVERAVQATHVQLVSPLDAYGFRRAA